MLVNDIMDFLARILHWNMNTDHETLSLPPENPAPTVPLNAPISPISPPEPIDGTFLWDTPENAKHSVRVICDNMGLSLADKNLICAVIMGESEFYNTAKNENKNSQGIVTSTDWGICQINDRFHIGKGKDFPSVQYVLDNPDKAVEFMIKMFKAGKLSMWCAYSNGSYKKYMV